VLAVRPACVPSLGFTAGAEALAEIANGFALPRGFTLVLPLAEVLLILQPYASAHLVSNGSFDAIRHEPLQRPAERQQRP
jgi:hypothetical protein